ncbi:hypothetical protein [Streptomyces sp. SP17KL33]|uniref:hypothetical protein n=1 Tax=Streptomyces sp. SP17KL33 TaxID=3002534 RepID=UPI002E7A6DD2|nr:hypothetical protein [Streptomyces sp. SP17KL33]MEE1834918.1 hypothetical protein [Streptomyces sp. SP17KL33]
MTKRIEWADLEAGKRLPDDQIRLRITDFDEEDITLFRLSLLGAVNWWKGIEIKNSGGQLVSFVEATGPQVGTTEVVWDAIQGGTIVLWKAGVFGIHTPMYHVDVPDHVKGKRLSFRWVADT